MEKFILLAIFGIAMAHVEAVVVVYLRKIFEINQTDSTVELLKNLPKRYVFIEKTRETATIVMLVILAVLAEVSWLDRLIVFLWIFAFWDLFYYISLYLLIKWPPKLSTMDVLFLIPRPWVAPVWFPIGLSFLTIIIIAVYHLIYIW